ncbi:MarR family transcriptional regulator [Subtercola sp. Z020]|uniref:MarR family winged helix-turn-helix transcriptional regulator n=1 Tax=Subtercola sp. Z020 TaxID=2080582 RepID=UPI000CE82E12|nr:MarR family transcriptional regulator [Subtercola sp. Z020]PPF80325.1 MarR family transcriptional regulator [Subtercola sp. Z020]
MTSEAVETAQHYWYDDDAQRQRSIAVLEAMRTYRAAEAAMQRRTQVAMGMGETDLLALRYLLRMHRAEHSVGPKELAAYLGISSASTTVLLDRLEKTGHLSRQPSPFDRRALIIVPTPASEEAVRRTLDGMHERMIAIASDLSPDDAQTIVSFLGGMRDAVDAIDKHDAGDGHDAIVTHDAGHGHGHDSGDGRRGAGRDA